MRSLPLLAGLLLPTFALASPWQFSEPLAITAHTGQGIFHHLESAGRHNIAVSGSLVAVAWEDDRDGTPRVHLAFESPAERAFTERATPVSGPGEAYDPSIAALPGGRFAVAWEEDGGLRVRLIARDAASPILTLGATGCAQASLAVDGDTLLLAAAEREGRFPRIRLHRLQIGQDLQLKAMESCPVDAQPPKDEQLYPALAVAGTQLTVAWEDRRPGHTIIMAARRLPGETCAFTPPQRISLLPPGRPKMPYGKGPGVARVTLAAFGHGRVLAAWADKRDFREGYDIYGAFAQPGQPFGDNVRIQDDFGEVARQWHASAAGLPDGSLVVAWDDERDGDANILLSWWEDGAWSDDMQLPGGSGPGEQTHPTVTFDQQGNLHAAWVEREQVGGPTRLRYAFGARTGN
jgi:hypothetical protein